MVVGMRRVLAGCVLTATGLAGVEARAQVAYLGEELDQQAATIAPAEAAPDEPEKRKKAELIVAPIPVANPALGTGAALAGVMYYNPNDAPDPWVTGIAGGYTSTDTWGVGFMHQMSLGDDRVRISALGGYGDARLKFYGIGASLAATGVSVDLRDKGLLGYVDAQVRPFDRGFLRHLHFGVKLSYMQVSSTVSLPTPNRPDLDLPSFELHSHVSAIGPSFTFDSRNDSLNPRRGVYVVGSWMFGADFLGSDFTHRKLEIAANGFFPLGKGTVLALRRSLCGVKGKAPFYDLCLFGKNADLRGFEAGRYRDGASWALQAEIRQHVVGRLGVVVFGGAGGIADDVKAIWKHSHVLVSGGGGLRYMVSRTNKVNLRFDIARGKDGTAFYFGIGEAF